MTNYQQMCEKAVEIQERWGPKEGDIRVSGGGYSKVPTFMPRNVPADAKDFYIWLPRIEDLIEMVHEDETSYLDVLFRFDQFIRGSLLVVPDNIATMWLLFVMHTLYAKQWNNGWEKVK